MIKLLKVVRPNAEISAEMVVELLVGEVSRRMKIAPRVLLVTLVDRVMGEELECEDESLRLQVIERILSMTEQAQPARIQPKSVLTFLWAIHPHTPEPEHFEMRAVRRRKATKSQLRLELQEVSTPVMEKDGTVAIP